MGNQNTIGLCALAGMATSVTINDPATKATEAATGGFKPTPQETFEVDSKRDAVLSAPPVPDEKEKMAPGGDQPTHVPETKPQPVGRRRIGMKLLAWSSYGGSAGCSIVFIILCFYMNQEFKDLQYQVKLADRGGEPSFNATSGVQGSSVLVDINGLSKVFEGAAVNGAVVLVAVVIYFVTSSVLLMCTCVSLAHPRKKFFRGACCGGAFFLTFVTLIAALQFSSLQSLVESMSKQYDTDFNKDILASASAFGYISSICYLVTSVMFYFWREKIVVEHQ